MFELKFTGAKIIDERLHKWQRLKIRKKMEEIGKEGVEALMEHTPKRTGKTAASWQYEIRESGTGRMEIVWSNTNFNQGVSIAWMIQYGHGTPRGGYVKGIDYINPALAPIFEEFGKRVMMEVVWS